MNISDLPREVSDDPRGEFEGYDDLDRALRDSFPTSDAPSATVVVRVGRPASDVKVPPA